MYGERELSWNLLYHCCVGNSLNKITKGNFRISLYSETTKDKGFFYDKFIIIHKKTSKSFYLMFSLKPNLISIYHSLIRLTETDINTRLAKAWAANDR